MALQETGALLGAPDGEAKRARAGAGGMVSSQGTATGSNDHTEFDVARDGRLLALEEGRAEEFGDLHVILGWAHAVVLLP